jgi:hypothetical protein
MYRVVYAILFYFVDYGIPVSQIKIVLFILANRECLIRWRIRTPQITLAFHWPVKINTMLIQRRHLIRHSRLANINNTIFRH